MSLRQQRTYTCAASRIFRTYHISKHTPRYKRSLVYSKRHLICTRREPHYRSEHMSNRMTPWTQQKLVLGSHSIYQEDVINSTVTVCTQYRQFTDNTHARQSLPRKRKVIARMTNHHENDESSREWQIITIMSNHHEIDESSRDRRIITRMTNHHENVESSRQKSRIKWCCAMFSVKIPTIRSAGTECLRK